MASQAVHLRHPNVHQDYVRAVATCCLDGLRSGRGLGYDLDVVLVVEDHGEPAAHQCLVIDHHDTDAHASPPPSGRRATTRKPPPARGLAVRLPPKSSARSRMPTMP